MLTVEVTLDLTAVGVATPVPLHSADRRRDHSQMGLLADEQMNCGVNAAASKHSSSAQPRQKATSGSVRSSSLNILIFESFIG